MLSAHGFFVPDSEYLVDPEGLVQHAAEEIAVFNSCIYCGAMFGRTVEGEGPGCRGEASATGTRSRPEAYGG